MILTNFFRYTTESILSGCITAWFGYCSAQGLFPISIRLLNRSLIGQGCSLLSTLLRHLHFVAETLYSVALVHSLIVLMNGRISN